MSLKPNFRPLPPPHGSPFSSQLSARSSQGAAKASSQKQRRAKNQTSSRSQKKLSARSSQLAGSRGTRPRDERRESKIEIGSCGPGLPESCELRATRAISSQGAKGHDREMSDQESKTKPGSADPETRPGDERHERQNSMNRRNLLLADLPESRELSTKCGVDRARGRGLRHRRPDLYRHLVIADLQRDRADGGTVFRTCRLLQILHGPPSLPQIVVMGDKLRRHLLEVKSRPQHVVVVCTRNTTCPVSVRISSNLHGCVGFAPQVYFRRGSTGYPPLLVRNSTAFCTGRFSRNAQQFRRFPAKFAHDFHALYQQTCYAHFHQLFRLFSGSEKGEKQAESKICGKGHLG